MRRKNSIKLYSLPESRLERAADAGRDEILKRIATKLYDNGYAAYLEDDRVLVDANHEINHLGEVHGNGEKRMK